jgi:hypothetical protein
VTPNDLVVETDILKTFHQGFYLAPSRWDVHVDSYNYIWHRVKFEEINKGTVPNVPGLYCFVVRPGTASMEISFPMYIGEAGYASSNTLRKRFVSYFSEQRRIKRPYITYLLNKWGDYVHFCYCVVDAANVANIKDYETELLGIILPRYNINDFPAGVKAPIKALR